MRTRLHQLITAYMANEINEAALARDFERAYNFEVDLSALSERERVAFRKLFDVLGLYSPHDLRVRESYRGYKSEADIRGAVEDTLAALK
jgi:hypothetical protein